MSNFNIMGSYSGIDMSVIDQMIEAEKSKGVQFTNRKDKIEREQGAWKDVGSRLTSLSQKTDVLSRRDTFESRTVKSSATGNASVSVTAGNSAPVGAYRIHVNQLATSSRVTGGRINLDTTDEAEKKKNPIDRDLKIEGKFSFTTDDLGLDKDNKEISKVFKIDIKQGDSLRKISENINAKTEESGIRASIVDNRLILTDTKMGDREITINFEDPNNDNLATELGFVENPKDKDGKPYSQLEKGQGAIFTIDGLEIERNTNRISDAIEGMAFTLTSKHADGESELITVTNNTQKGVDAVKEFVDQYNSVMNFIQTQTDVGTPSEDSNTTGALVGEGSIMRLQSGLRSLLTSRIAGDSDIKAASDIGITTDRYGVASLDEAKLNEVLREDPESVARFFYKPEAIDVGDTTPSGKIADQTKGMSELFKNLVETYTSTTKGIISTKNKSYERMVKDINEQIETFNERIDKKRARYIQQFAALDEAMMRAESQMDYLYSQMNIE